MSFALPAALVMVGLMLLVAVRRFRAPVARVEGLTTEVERQLAELGPLSRGEIGACAVFGLAIFGWLLPSVFRLTWGAEDVWSTWAHGYLHEGVVAIVAAALLFAIPSGRTDDDDGEGNRLLGWREAQAIDWGTLMLLGGGLALGDLTSQTGLADAIGHGIMDLAGSIVHHPLGLTAAAAVLVVFLTEVTSNTATISMMLPVLIGVARAGGVDPIPTAIAVTLAGSMAFMLPVATPPNAMAYGTRMIRIDMMIRTGVRLNLIGFAVLMLLVIGLLPWVL
jgi:sodium-dependent dicarboxylate transporter 2/3/5